ncbi:hypothetical protein DXG03_009553 [Asterophora parasitica]|uniref:Cytochrome P450 n=1 Tax=Asterophora parasitica TaxID=117018 RepID=A0A9P7G4T2_9AGAR|nr:hypothetical protein DXG03_009553 [Asterophora parasitica]
MAVVTPGIDFIARSLVKVVVPSVIFAFTMRILSDTYHYNISTWVLVSSSVIFVPFLSIARVIYKRFDHKRQAAAFGARLAPTIDGKSIGNIDILSTTRTLWDTGYPADGLTEVFGEKGPIVNMRILWSDMIFTCSPEHIKTILATDFNNYVKGDMWKFHRSMTRPFFTRDRISDFELFDRHADTAIALIKERMRGGHAIDFQDLMSRFTLDSASEFLFGHCVHSLTAGLPYPHNASYVPPESKTPQSARADDFARAFLEAQEIISSRERFGWIWPLAEVWGDKTKEPMKVVNAYLDPIIQEAIAKKDATPKAEKEKTEPSHVEDGATLLDHLVSLTSGAWNPSGRSTES